MGHKSSIHIVSCDEVLLASARAACSPIDGWNVRLCSDAEELLSDPPTSGDVVLLDGWAHDSGENVYETCRRLTGVTRCRTFMVAGSDVALSGPIASFCGATGVLGRPLSTSAVRAMLEQTGPPAALPKEGRGDGHGGLQLPETLLRDLVGDDAETIVRAITDPETSLFSYEFLSFKLDEEFKRAQRFRYPLSCVMLGFDGQAAEAVLRQLAAIILGSSRDTDVLGRFDESSFLFLLPHTGPDGAGIMAGRIRESVEEEGLRDLVGDRLEISVGISSYPHPEVRRREDLFARARNEFLSEAPCEGS
jgi:diguanylate cyclase (GGDEF)-like protein